MRGIVFSICLLLALAGGGVRAAPPVVELATGDWPPYVSRVMTANGAFADMTRQVFRRAGYQVHFNYLSWPMAEEMVRSGKALAALPYRPTPERAREFDFSDPIMRTGSYFFYYKPKLKHPPLGYQSLDELRGYRIGVQRGFWYLPLFQQHQLNTLYTDDEVSVLKLLRLGLLDLAPLSRERAQFLAHAVMPEQENQFGYLPASLDDTPLALMFSRRYPEAGRLKQDFARALAAMREDGSLQAIYQRNFPELTPQR
nr:transporter substrate-binding domain-containing protein [Chromobacterium sp. ASV5]